MKNKKFRDVLNKWYDKLEKEGFQDIENRDNPDGPMRGDFSSSNSRRALTRATLDLREVYFSDAENFLNSFDFDSSRDEVIWRLHSTGMSARAISASLKLAGFKKKISKTTVSRIIGKYRKMMRKGFNES